MFSGIVEEIGTVKAFEGGRLSIGCRRALEGTKLGDSVNVNGACLTVVGLTADSFSVDLMPETIRRTNLGELRPGAGVNLERALSAADRMGGHFVQGHVEGTGRIASFTREGDAVIVRFEVPAEVGRYLVPKGFVAVDGISLTVVDCEPTGFTVSLVQYTQENTTLARQPVGAAVNLETDIIGRYIVQYLEQSGLIQSLEKRERSG